MSSAELYQGAESIAEQVKNAVDARDARIISLDNRLALAKGDIDRLTSKLNKSRESLKAAEEHNSSLSRQVAKITQRYNDAVTCRKILENTYSGIVGSCKSRIAELEENERNLVKKIALLSEERDHSETVADILLAENKRLRSEVANMNRSKYRVPLNQPPKAVLWKTDFLDF